jgi:hypothetical protein
MNAIRVLKHIDSDVVHAIPELRELLGQDVELTATPQHTRLHHEPLETLETFLGDAAHCQPLTPEELAELRAAAATDPVLASVLDFADSVEIDVDAIVRQRADSRE